MEGRQLNYDAFVCFNAYGESSKDFEFVKELIRRFESPPYNFRLFVPHRDDLAGLAKHNITATIISQRYVASKSNMVTFSRFGKLMFGEIIVKNLFVFQKLYWYTSLTCDFLHF